MNIINSSYEYIHDAIINKMIIANQYIIIIISEHKIFYNRWFRGLSHEHRPPANNDDSKGVPIYVILTYLV